MTIQDYLRVLGRHWFLVLLCALVGTGLAFGVTQTMPKVYVATTTQFVRGLPTGTTAGADYQAAQFAQSRAKSYSVMIGNPDVLAGIISDLNLDMTPGDLYPRLTVENPIDTPLLNVTARGRTADEAQELSVAAANNLTKLILRLESAGTTRTSPIDIQTAVPALKPTQPSSPRLLLNVAVGSMLGLAIGSVLALIRDSRPARARGRQRQPRGAEPSPMPPVERADPASPTSTEAAPVTTATNGSTAAESPAAERAARGPVGSA
ncbi:MAG TPA: hypothetical protein P5181_06225 [Dermatophilaceae bacterium]|nr:hypothetical protein [Dermatophilaceae bacterium]